jgi:hypothetical protein
MINDPVEFEKLEKRFDELMDLIDIQLEIMTGINKENPFKFIWHSVITNKFRNASKLSGEYLKESRYILYKLYGE